MGDSFNLTNDFTFIDKNKNRKDGFIKKNKLSKYEVV